MPKDINVSGISMTYAAGSTVVLYWAILVSITALFSYLALHRSRWREI